MYSHRQTLVGPELQGTWLQLQQAAPAEILCQTFFNWLLKERNVMRNITMTSELDFPSQQSITDIAAKIIVSVTQAK